MKLIFTFITLIISPFVMAADDCNSQISSYVIRGDLTATTPGARLWRLDKLKKDAASNTACAKEIFARATKESDDYWSHIDSKYSCGVTNKDASRDSEKCSDAMNDNVLSNKAYLALVKVESQTAAKPCPLNTNPVLSVSAQRNLLDASVALQTTVNPSNKCDKVPLADRMETGSKSLESGFSSCITGLITGFFKEGIFKTVNAIWSKLSDPWGTLQALGEVAKAFIKDPAGTAMAIANRTLQSLYKTFFAKYENFDCFNSNKKAAVICSSLGQGGAVIIETLIGAKILKSGLSLLNRVPKGPVLNTIYQGPTLPGMAPALKVLPAPPMKLLPAPLKPKLLPAPTK